MADSRNKTIVKTSIIGVAVNALLSVLKIIIGTLSGSIAIILDAINNLSDAASSIITIVGAKLAGKEPDKKHPFGHGRIEYFSALVISLLVLYAGVTSLEESVSGILHPEIPDYTTASLVIIAVAVVVKIMLGNYFIAAGRRVDSDSLINSGRDAALDSVISFGTLAAAVIFLCTGISLEAYLGAIISLIIIKSGCDMMRETVSRLLGERVDADMAKAIGETIMEFPTVHGVYDLVLHDYGPDSYQGSVHIEVPDTCRANELDNLIRSITIAVYEKHHVLLTAIGVYSINTIDEEVIRIREEISSMALKNEYITQMHGFYLDKEQMTIRLDLVVSFDAKDRRSVFQEVESAIQQKYPEYQINMAMDTDFIA
ncbi:MAG: cation diffusion facilitator family transporter [Lachnospiraceae bacterium]|nr:cation diffusion facilitator family transporter [Lachnospiraceae bacterium]